MRWKTRGSEALSDLSSAALTSRIEALVRQERFCLVDFLTSGPERALDSGIAVPVTTAAVGSGPERAVDSGMAASAGAVETSSGPERAVDTSVDHPATLAVALAPLSRRSRIEPIDAERHLVKLTVGREFMAELAEVKAALSHVVPDGNLEALLRSCMQKTLELCGRRKRGACKARACSETVSTGTSGPEVEAPAPAPIEPTGGSIRGGKRTRYVKAEVRRAVWERDGGACTFVGTNEKRCGSRHQVEFDHVKPFAWGGPGTIDNLTLRCRAHNQHRAREHFGEEHMAKRSHRARPEPTGGLFEPLTVADPP